MQLLLASGADVDAPALPSNGGANPLIAAAAGGWENVVKLLLSRSADINASRLCSPLIFAACGGHVQVMKVLIDRGADVNALMDGHQLLVHTTGYGHVEAVKLLLRHGAGGSGEQVVQAANKAAGVGHMMVWAVLVQHALTSHPTEVVRRCLQGRLFERAVRAMGSAWQEDVSSIEQQQAEVDKEMLEVVEMKKCAQQLIVQGIMLQKQGDEGKGARGVLGHGYQWYRRSFALGAATGCAAAVLLAVFVRKCRNSI